MTVSKLTAALFGLVTAVFFTLVLTGCEPSAPTVCAAGESIECACTDGATGAQTCLSDGSAYTACDCGSSGGGPDGIDALEDGSAGADAGSTDASIDPPDAGSETDAETDTTPESDGGGPCDPGPCGPCEPTIDPVAILFGPKPVGQVSVLPLSITACDTRPAILSGIALDPDGNPGFSLEEPMESLAGSITWPPTEANPLVILSGETFELNVRYVPPFQSLETQPHTSSILMQVANSDTIAVPLSGSGITNCPTAAISIAEGEEVNVQTTLHLSGANSEADIGSITQWEWSVGQPDGSASTFGPSASSPSPTFEANVAGSYLFYLDVWDENGTKSCMPATAQIVALPGSGALHIELLWDTPGDPDPTNEGPEAGSDLDLHFLHPEASGPDLDGDGAPDGWFDQPFDCFWFNPYPQWGDFDPTAEDDPSLDLDDTDGAGPENLNMSKLENDLTYRVGVHYWSDHGFGESFATIRVYIYAQLVYEATGVKMDTLDMWDVCTIDWPTGTVTPITNDDGSHKITPNYQNPLFHQP